MPKLNENPELHSFLNELFQTYLGRYYDDFGKLHGYMYENVTIARTRYRHAFNEVLILEYHSGISALTIKVEQEHSKQSSKPEAELSLYDPDGPNKLIQVIKLYLSQQRTQQCNSFRPKEQEFKSKAQQRCLLYKHLNIKTSIANNLS